MRRFRAGTIVAVVAGASTFLIVDHREPTPKVQTSSTVWTRPPETTTTTVLPTTTTAAVPVTTTTAPPVATTTTAPPATRRSLGTFKATCYGAFEGYGGRTASGEQSGPGSIAVDPTRIPMGTKLYVEGYGPGHANDVGGAIKGARVDVWFRTAAECRAWGLRSVEVFAR